MWTNLKLRLSWGQTGNADISTNAFASYQAANGWVGADHNPVTAVTKAKLENPDLKWETTTEWNFGLDFGFLKDRITGSVDVYLIKRSNKSWPISERHKAGELK